MTEKYVKEFQLRNNLEPDGVVGKLTWNKLFNITESQKPNYKINYEKLVYEAKRVIDNYIKRGTKYNQSKRQFGLNASYADCSSTTSTIIELAGLKSYLSSTNTRSMKSEILSKGGKFKKNPEKGDIMLWGGHVTIVVEIKDGFVYFAHMGGSGPKIGKVKLSNGQLTSENVWGSGGFIGFWKIS